MAARQVPPGALSGWYDIPVVHKHESRLGGGLPVAVIIAIGALARRVLAVHAVPHATLLMIAWLVSFIFAAFQWLMCWRDRPVAADAASQQSLDQLAVAVIIPVYNEDPALLDRCLWSMAAQTRPPDHVVVVDDGSTSDYSALQRHWEATSTLSVRWIRQSNSGKKHAQVTGFTAMATADAYVTVDSDTALEMNALAEALKPLADPRVMSVAGIELAFNSASNWLTRTVSARSLLFQVVACGTQSALGEVLVNRGAFALYRADMIREIIPAYTGETFLGRPIKLGDDAALTLFARGRGRAVQQSSAFALTMYPETISHHLRQWTRWMRGSTIRTCWRLRYLPLTSYGWWFIALGTWLFLASTATPFIIAATWPVSESYLQAGAIAILASSYLTAARTTCIRRSDENWLYRLGTVLSFPAAIFWGVLVLRPIRFYGIATCLRQGWKTRTSVEVHIAPVLELEAIQA